MVQASAIELPAKVSFRLFDIAANLSDASFRGIYGSKQYHKPDFEQIIQKSKNWGVQKFLFSAGHLEDAQISYDLSLKDPNFYATIGIHPCRATEPFKDLKPESSEEDKEKSLADYFRRIEEMIETAQQKEKFVAIGECGLDYDRFTYADKETQLRVFPGHFDLAKKFGLPMYLHSRNTEGDFIRMVRDNRDKFSSGVVHSFSGEKEEMEQLVALDLYIGINGCSMKTEESLEVVKAVPLEKLMLETDCPYCDIRNSHASKKYVKTEIKKVDKKKFKGPEETEAVCKDRNEPCTMIQVLEVVAALKGLSEEEVAEAAWENTCRLFK